MNTTESPQGRRSPTRYSDEDRERLIREHAHSGLTKKAFCAQRGIVLSTFFGWSSRKVERPKGASFAEVEVTTGLQMNASVEVLLPNGARIGIRHQGKQSDLISLVRGVAGATC